MRLTGSLPTGTVTFLFTDIEGSTRLVQSLGDSYRGLLAEHQRLLRSTFAAHDGVVVGTEGDSFFVVFRAAPHALAAAVAVQLAIENHLWPENGRIRVRIGIHAGQGVLGDESYVGLDVHRAARIAAAGHGGQILISESVRVLSEDAVPDGVSLRDLGEHRLKDLVRPERVFQVDHAGLQTRFPPVGSMTRRTNLPAQPSELIGREAEIRGIGEILADAQVRLLTLSGPGGTGKTSLALRSAVEHGDRFDAGVHFIDLSSVDDVDAAFEAVIRTMGLSGVNRKRPLETLAEDLGEGRVLLVLDNLEQIADAPRGIGELLQACSGVTVLATSREALRIRGERIFLVPPLDIPAATPDGLRAADVADVEAVRLFVHRARGSRPDFSLTDDNAGAVVEICIRLDGLPLAIELAAARLVVFSPSELRDRLRGQLDVLAGGSRDLPERQQTLRSTIEWSDRLLSDTERALFRLVSVFPSARIGDVEQVAARLDELRDVAVLEGLLSLVEKSLVISAEVDGHRRLSMLQTIREFAAEQLDEDPVFAQAVRRAHASHFAKFARARRDHVSGPERGSALDELEAEIENAMTAWRYWVALGDVEQLDMLLDGLWALHDDRGWYHGAIELTNDLLGVLTSSASPQGAGEEIAVRTSLARALMAMRGYTEEVEDAYRRALALLEQADAPQEIVPVLRSLASLHLYRGEFDRGVVIGRQLLELAEERQDRGLQVEGNLRLGANLMSLGDTTAGLEHLNRAIDLFDPNDHASSRFRLGPSPGVVPLTTSAFVLWLIGYPDQALARCANALEVAEQLRHPYTMAYALFHVAFVDLWRREWQLMHERATTVLRIADDHDYHVWHALALVFLGVATTALGHHEEGLDEMERGIGLYRGLTTPPVFWPLLLSVRAGALGMAGRFEEGHALLDEALASPRGRPNVLQPEIPLLKGDLFMAASQLDDAEAWFRRAFDAAAEVGARMPQLRAASRLTRLRRVVGASPDESDILRGVYSTFTEGFDTPDLIEARTLLDGSSA